MPVDSNEIVNKLIGILATDYTSRQVNLSSNLVTDLGLDSLSIVDLTLRLENEFQITDLDYDPREMQTVLDLAQVINQKLSTPSSPVAGR